MTTAETELLERKAIANILFEEGPPRYKGCPPICTIANLPSFETASAAEAWHEKNAPGCKIESPYRCPSCNWFHYKSHPRDPAGDTSGTTRTQKHKKDPKK